MILHKNNETYWQLKLVFVLLWNMSLDPYNIFREFIFMDLHKI